jgi:glycine cleavage system aminomethyltransferase T
MISPDMAATGTRFFVRLADGRMLEAQVAAFPFYDPAGERQKAATVEAAA